MIDVSKVKDQNAAFSFAKGLQQQVQLNKVKLDLKYGLASRIKQFKRERESSPTTLEEGKSPAAAPEETPVGSMFNKTIEEETKAISNIARTFIRKNEYADKFKRRELSTDRKGQDYDLDPRIKYFKKCLQEQNLVLPILDKIYKKTLCLQDYLLSDGICKGLAEACKLFDHTVVNRVLFSNCGITGDQFALILEGLTQLKDFKSIIYKMNTVNARSILMLKPIFEKRLPNHLEELKIIDCKIHSSMITQLLTAMLDSS